MKLHEFLSQVLFPKSTVTCRDCRYLVLEMKKIEDEYSEIHDFRELVYYYCKKHNRYVLISNECCNDYNRI